MATTKTGYWKRTYKVLFPDLDYKIEDSLKIEFDIQKDMTAETNKSNITIYNLSEPNRAKISVADTKVEIYVGYEGNGGYVCVFKGTVIQAVTKWDNSDIKTKLDLSDGQVEIRDSEVSVSYPPNTPVETCLRALARMIGLAIEFGEGAKFGTFSEGYSYVGNGWQGIQDICKGSGCTASIQNNIIQIILNGGVFTNKGQVFSASTGLIGSPELINRASPYEDKSGKEKTPKRARKQKDKKERPEKKAGWRIKTLLSPTVNCGDAVKVEAKQIVSWFRVESLHHKGTNYGGDWQSEFDLIEGATSNDAEQ